MLVNRCLRIVNNLPRGIEYNRRVNIVDATIGLISRIIIKLWANSIWISYKSMMVWLNSQNSGLRKIIFSATHLNKKRLRLLMNQTVTSIKMVTARTRLWILWSNGLIDSKYARMSKKRFSNSQINPLVTKIRTYRRSRGPSLRAIVPN